MMLRIGIIPFIVICFLMSSCKKENGKREYEMQLLFDNGEVYKDEGIVSEKKMKQYDGTAIYTTVFNDYTFLKGNGKLICSGQLIIIGGKHGDIYFEGAYTQKGRAYIVEDGYFEVIWRDNAGDPLTNSVLTGKWTLKRK
ncbi:hypothetical protein D3C71_1125570 [compost metagenome]